MNTSRTEMLIGAEGVRRLGAARVLIVGLGGVGGYCAEALARAGIGGLTLVDGDTVSESNFNRQILATAATLGQAKAAAAAARIASINPDCRTEARVEFWTLETIAAHNLAAWDFTVDAVDTVTAKLALAVAAERDGARLVSVMGSGNRTAADFEFADLYATANCPLARVMRAELKKRGVGRLAVVYSRGPAASKAALVDHGRHAPGSISYVPATAGLKAAEYVIRSLLGERL